MSKKIYIGSTQIAGLLGKSAYQSWLDAGHTGTESDFLASLQGNSGYTGAAGELEVVNNLTDGGATAALSAEMGKNLNNSIGFSTHSENFTSDNYSGLTWGGSSFVKSNASYNSYIFKLHPGTTCTITKIPQMKRVVLFQDTPGVGVATPSGTYTQFPTSISLPYTFTVPESQTWLYFGVTLSQNDNDAAFTEYGNGLKQMEYEFDEANVTPDDINTNRTNIQTLFEKTGWTDEEEWSIAGNTNTNHYFSTDFRFPIRFTYWTDNPAADMQGDTHKLIRIAEYNENTHIGNHDFYLDETNEILITEFNSATTRLLVYGATQQSVITNYKLTMEHIGTLSNELELRIASVGLREYSGLNVVCLGDSITEGLGGTPYPVALANYSKMNVFNCGFGGSDWAQRAEQTLSPTSTTAYAAFDLVNLVKSWCDKDFSYIDAAQNRLSPSGGGDNNAAQIAALKAMSVENTDIVIIMAGVNDFTRNKALGNEDSESKSEVSGAINLVVQYLLSANPNLVIYLANNKRYYNNGNFSDAGLSDNITNGQGLHLRDYNDCISRQAKKWNIPVCDMHDTLGWNVYNHSLYFSSDGAHCTTKGYQIIARKLYSFIKANEIF